MKQPKPQSPPKVTMIPRTPSPSQRIKKLHRNKTEPVSLKDFAVELSQNGTKEEQQLVESWLANKAGEPSKPKTPAPPAPSKLTLTKPTSKKRG